MVDTYRRVETDDWRVYLEDLHLQFGFNCIYLPSITSCLIISGTAGGVGTSFDKLHRIEQLSLEGYLLFLIQNLTFIDGWLDRWMAISTTIGIVIPFILSSFPFARKEAQCSRQLRSPTISISVSGGALFR